MKKYLVIFKLAWHRVLVYKGVSAIFLLLSLINIFLTISVWTVAYKNPLQRPSELFSVFIAYFLITILFNQVVSSFAAGEMADEHIKRGELTIFLLRPFPYFLYEMLMEIPWRLLAFIMSLPAVFLIWWLFRSLVQLHPLSIVTSFSLVIGSYVLSFLLQICFAMLTFWMEDTRGMLSFLEVTTLLFSGVGIPIFFFPPLLRTVSYWLPFQYTLYFPVVLALGRLEIRGFILMFVSLLTWIIILGLLAKLLWYKGLKKFTGEGI